ncbi:MAG: hypothetical protein QNJ46_21475 [Leptolyngbyaceae cyanobacterium MO_188.B28]|nr:hypothetical protein [Leptolyngbyaceae cyanobacterium MO_188.B28]
MSTPYIHIQPWAAQIPTQQQLGFKPNIWMMSSGILLIVLAGVSIFSSIQLEKTRKRLKFEEYKNRDLQKKVKLALGTITKMERNPDLIHSREFNLDYLRMRMDEDQFNFAIVNQLKVKVKQKISVALRPQQATQGMVGIASKPRQVDEMFDVEYTTSQALGAKKRVLFRIQIKLAKLPTQTTSTTINQIIDCIETFLKPDSDHSNWQPTLQGRIAYMHWDQKAKPTPLLVLEQSKDGVNVTFRSTNRSVSPTGKESPKPTDGGVPNPTPSQHTQASEASRRVSKSAPSQDPNQISKRSGNLAASQSNRHAARHSVVGQSTRHTANQAANQADNKGSSRITHQPVRRSVNQTTSRTHTQTANPKLNQSTSQNSDRSNLKQTARHPTKHRAARQ